MRLKRLCFVPLAFWLACGSAETRTQGLGAIGGKSSIQLKAVASGDESKPAITDAAAKPLTIGQPLEEGATIQTSSTGRASFSGPDLRRFEVNADTELRVGGGGFALKKGEVFLEAPPEANKKLTIEIPEGTLTTDGAAFNIRTSGNTTEVNVLRGQVSIQSRGAQTTVRTAEKAIVDASGVKKGPSADFTALTQWTLALQKSADRPQSQDDTLPPPGFGTLSAKTPGTTKERPFKLLSQKVSVTIEDQIAKTEVEEVFENPSDVVVEGSFRFTLPEGASINRYAMYVKDTLMEGEIVEREEGRKILKAVIDEFLEEQAQLRDPALVEWTQGNTFSTRIFPILPREKKRVILSYTQRLDTQDGNTRYTYPLAVAGTKDKIEKFTLEAKVSSGQGAVVVNAPLYPMKTSMDRGVTTTNFEASNFQAPADLVLDVVRNSTEQATLVTSAAKGAESPFFLLSLKPEFIAEEQKAESQNWIFLLDSSQSQTTTQMAIQRGMLPVLFSSLDYQDQVKVLTYDYSTKEITSGFTKVSDTLGNELASKLEKVEPAGATNLAKALQVAAEAAEGKPVRVMVMGDLSPSIGEIRANMLAEQSKKLFAPGSTISTVGIGSSVDDLVLEALPQAMGGVSYRITDGEDLTNAAARILSGQLRPILSDVSVSIDGVQTRDVYPNKMSSLALGRELVMVGRYQGQGKSTITVKGRVGTKAFEQKFNANFSAGSEGNKFIAPLWAKDRIDFLTQTADATSRAEITKLSKEMGVMSRYTSFIVLENDAMYREFGVEQAAKERKKEASTESAGRSGIIYEQVDPEEQASGDSAGGAPNASPITAAPAPEAAKAEPSAGIAAPSKTATKSPAKKTEPKDAASEADATLRPFDKNKKSDSGAMAKPSMGRFDDGFGRGKYYHAPVCKTVTGANFKVGAPVVSEATEKEIAELRTKIASDALVRSSHQKLVSKLMSAGRFPEALDAALVWRRLDSANIGLLQTLGELYRLGGRPEEALRIMSGALDIDPENAETVETLALYESAKGRTDDAYALRLGRALRRPNDPAVQLELAEAAAKDQMNDEVIGLLSSWVEVDAKGKVNVKAKLSSAQKTKVLKLYSNALGASTGASASKALGTITSATPTKANLSVELTWEGEADLDLWVAGPKGKPLFGEHFVESQVGGKAETLLAEKAKMGRYRIQVFDASAKKLNADIKGKVIITGFKGGAEKKKEISFTLKPGGGLELGSVSLSTRQDCRYY